MVLRDQLSVNFLMKDEIWVAVLHLDYTYREENFHSSDTQVVTIPKYILTKIHHGNQNELYSIKPVTYAKLMSTSEELPEFLKDYQFRSRQVKECVMLMAPMTTLPLGPKWVKNINDE